MTPKEKANDLYASAIKLHGSYRAKDEALNSAIATHSLVPYTDEIKRDYWKQVIKHLKL
jgi:hypothetical protein